MLQSFIFVQFVWVTVYVNFYYTFIFVYILQCYLALIMIYQNYFNTTNVFIYFLQQISQIN